jgi:hypothetical protein
MMSPDKKRKRPRTRITVVNQGVWLGIFRNLDLIFAISPSTFKVLLSLLSSGPGASADDAVQRG